jgi:hypothetical protein
MSITEAAIKYARSEAVDLIDSSSGDVSENIKSLVGYVESEHKDEVLKGALMGANIVKGRLADAVKRLLDENKRLTEQLHYHEYKRKQFSDWINQTQGY